jgi:hypothetical protein
MEALREEHILALKAVEGRGELKLWKRERKEEERG